MNPLWVCRLIQITKAGKTEWLLIHGPKPRFPPDEKIEKVVELTRGEAKMTRDEVVELCRAGRLTAQIQAKQQGTLL